MTQERRDRQRLVAKWAIDTFGANEASSIKQRGVRFLEEAIEAYQAAGCDREMAHRLVDYIFHRPAGELWQEIGGAGLTLLLLADAAGIDADNMESAEVARVRAKSADHFRVRNQTKNDAGFLAVDKEKKGKP